MRKWLPTALSLLMLPAAVSGCSETSFQNALDIGKAAPDETKVRTVQPLSVPPDLQLRPPAQGTSSSQPRQASTNAVPGLSMPPVDGAPAAATSTPAATAPSTAAATTTAAGESSFYDIYRKRGISIYKPDGTKKKISELNRELAEKLKEEKRRKNPRYGSIFNIDSLWKD